MKTIIVTPENINEAVKPGNIYDFENYAITITGEAEEDNNIATNTAINTVIGATGAIVSNILEDVIKKGFGRYAPIADYVIDSAQAALQGEALGTINDLNNERTNERRLIDVYGAFYAGATGTAAVWGLGLVSGTLPAIAIGIGVSSVVGAFFSHVQDQKEKDEKEDLGRRSRRTGSRQNSGNTQNQTQAQEHNQSSSNSGSHQEDAWLDMGTQTNGSGSSDDTTTPTNTSTHYERTGHKVGEDRLSITVYEKGKNSDGTDSGWWRTTHTSYDDNGTKRTVERTYQDKDSDNDGTPDQSDAHPNDASKQMPNPMNDNGDTSDYDGRHDGLRGFRGDIDYGPDGKKGKGHDEKYDILIGFNPRIDYGPDGKPGRGYNGEFDDLKGFNPRIDWDRDHVDSREFKGNALTDRLGKINPRAIRKTLENTSVVENSQQARKMGITNIEFIFDTQVGVLFHNANGSKKGFGSGGAIAEIGIDHDLSLVTVDFF